MKVIEFVVAVVAMAAPVFLIFGAWLGMFGVQY